MSENLHKVDDLFKKAIERHEDAPSAKVWDAIDKNLDKSKVVSISKKYNNLKWAAAALLIFSFGMAMYTWHTKMKNKELVKKNITIKNQTNQSAELNSNSKIYGNDSTTTAKNKVKINNDSIDKNRPSKNDQQQKTVSDSSDNNSIIPGNVVINPSFKKENFSSGNNYKTSTPQSAKNIVVKDEQVKQNKIVTNKDDQIIPGKILSNTDGTSNDELNTFLTQKYFLGIPLLPYSLGPLVNNVLQHHDPLAVNNTVSNELLKNAMDADNKNPGQSKKTKTKTVAKSLFSAIIFFSPESVTANVKDDHPRFREDDKNEIKNNERIKSAYSFGALIDYSIGKNIKLQSGVSVFTRVTDINPKTLYARPDEHGNVNYHISCTAGSAYVSIKGGTTGGPNNPPPPPNQGDSAKSLSAKNILQYISIPLAIKYTIGKGKFTLSPAAGIAYNILSKGKIETAIATQGGHENTGTNDIQGLKSSYINSSIGISAEYKLSKRISLSLAPGARLALSSINKNAPVKTNLNSIGIAGGLNIRL